ncbi:hypothetical protein NC652_012447 [Populus alba x Populus x berolinensis]|nr:hypothetical protein NC652_012447 [Populus alba x Populus x berolinensis]
MASESSVTEPKTAPIENQTSVEATIKGSTTTTSSQGGAATPPATTTTMERLQTLAMKNLQVVNLCPIDGFWVLHHGELALECVNAYYLYGRALLYKAQEEADPVAMLPKKDSESKQDDNKDGASRNFVNGEFSSASVSSNVEEGGGSNHPEGAAGGASSGKDKEEEDDGGSDDEDAAEADEEESDLDLAWKMLDVARAIAEKHLDDTMDKVDILSALAEVALEREDIETSLSDYQKALSILERLVEPDSRHLAELYPYQGLDTPVLRL